MKSKLTVLFLFCSISLIYSGTAHAQQNVVPKTSGLLLNVHGNGNYFNSRIGDGTVGGLMGAKVGVGIKKVSFFLQLDVATLNADKFSEQYNDMPLLFLSFGVGGQYHFPIQNSSLVPYLEAGMNLQYFSPPSDDEQNWLGYGGYGPSFGGGAKYFLSDTFSLDIAFISSYGTYNHTYTNRSGNEMEVNSFNLQLNAGFSWYPF